MCIRAPCTTKDCLEVNGAPARVRFLKLANLYSERSVILLKEKPEIGQGRKSYAERRVKLDALSSKRNFANLLLSEQYKALILHSSSTVILGFFLVCVCVCSFLCCSSFWHVSVLVFYFLHRSGKHYLSL